MKKDGSYTMVAKTFFGLEDILADELSAINASDIYVRNRAVSFRGNREIMYKANLCLRTAIKVLKPLNSFSATDEKSLYEGVRRIVWSDHISPRDTFAVESVVNSKYFKHSGYAALKTKDAIVDSIRDATGARPSVDTKDPGIRVNIHIAGRDCTVSLDSSGEPLYKRGYRTDHGMAPLNESLAAGLVLMTGWKGGTAFLDPMCGSGTIVIEAAMIACCIPPNINREKFGFCGWKDFDEHLLDKLQKDTSKSITMSDVEITASDISEKAFRITRQNIKNAGFENAGIRVLVRSFEELKPPGNEGVIVMNPPYDERIRSKDINGFYKLIGDTLKKRFTGYDAWIISSNFEALKHIGLRPSVKYDLYNGQLKAKYQQFKMYSGSLKTHKQ